MKFQYIIHKVNFILYVQLQLAYVVYNVISDMIYYVAIVKLEMKRKKGKWYVYRACGIHQE